MANPTDDLKTILANGQALIICGAGVSAALTGNKAPGWKALIQGCVEYCKVHGFLNENDLEDCERWLKTGSTTEQWLFAADRVRKKLGSNFRASLGNVLEGLETTNQLLIQCFGTLQNAGNAIATTNYDGLLALGLGSRPVTWRYPVDAMRVVEGQNQNVLHLHGHWTEPDSVVFSTVDYVDVSKNDSAQFVQKLAIHNRSLVFVGSSLDGLTDANMGELLKWFSSNWRDLGKQHFVLCLTKDLEGWPPAVTAISYGENHGDLTGFLQSIAPPRKDDDPRLEVRPNMIGRQKELAEVVGWVLADRHPIIIPGGPGMGKSALALEVAHHSDVVARFGNERYFLRLDKAGASDAQSMVNAIALKLDMQPSGGAEKMAESIVRSCTMPTLVVLDNLETSWDKNRDAVETVIARLAASAQLNLLLTIRGETPVINCDNHKLKDLRQLETMQATELFLRVAGHQYSNDIKLHDLIALLDGHPLSIILMAAQADGESTVESMIQRWRVESAKMLKMGNANNSLNNLTICVALSFEKLSIEAKRLVRLVALLPAGLAIWLAQEILGSFLTGGAERQLRKARLINNQLNRLLMLSPLRAAILQMPVQSSNDEKELLHILHVIAVRGCRGFDKLSIHERNEIENLDAALTLSLKKYQRCLYPASLVGLTVLHVTTGRGSTASIDSALALFKLIESAKVRRFYIRYWAHFWFYRFDYEATKSRLEAVLNFFSRIPEPENMGQAHLRLAQLSENLEAAHHLAEARKLWLSIGREDLVAKFLEG